MLIITHVPNYQWFIQGHRPRLSNMAALTLENVIYGHHVYKSRWTSLLAETLNTCLELDNEHDKCAVSIVKSGEIVGHVQRSILKLFHFFIQHDGEITCEVTGFGHGLEVPCYYSMKGRKRPV